MDSLRETIPSMEEELKVISSQWESKWEEVGKHHRLAGGRYSGYRDQNSNSEAGVAG